MGDKSYSRVYYRSLLKTIAFGNLLAELGYEPETMRIFLDGEVRIVVREGEEKNRKEATIVVGKAEESIEKMDAAWKVLEADWSREPANSQRRIALYASMRVEEERPRIILALVKANMTRWRHLLPGSHYAQ